MRKVSKILYASLRAGPHCVESSRQIQLAWQAAPGQKTKKSPLHVQRNLRRNHSVCLQYQSLGVRWALSTMSTVTTDEDGNSCSNPRSLVHVGRCQRHDGDHLHTEACLLQCTSIGAHQDCCLTAGGPIHCNKTRQEDKKITSFQPAWLIRCSTPHRGQPSAIFSCLHLRIWQPATDLAAT